MNRTEFSQAAPRDRVGMKGPRAAQCLAALGFAVPAAPNTWTGSLATDEKPSPLLARLGTNEFFLEDCAGGTALRDCTAAFDASAGVYPVLREDAAFFLSGDGASEVLAQVCNVNFADLNLDARPVIMTLMIGVAVLVIPQRVGTGPGTASASAVHYRIWCDPTYGVYMERSLELVVAQCGGTHRRVAI